MCNSVFAIYTSICLEYVFILHMCTPSLRCSQQRVDMCMCVFLCVGGGVCVCMCVCAVVCVRVCVAIDHMNVLLFGSCVCHVRRCSVLLYAVYC